MQFYKCMELFKGRKAEDGQRVQVYRNHHREMWTVRDAKTKKVLAHGHDFWLSQAEFIVKDAGRKRYLTRKQRNVHAWVEGTFYYSKPVNTAELLCLAKYNPTHYRFFYDEWTKMPFIGTDYIVYFSEDECWATWNEPDDMYEPRGQEEWWEDSVDWNAIFDRAEAEHAEAERAWGEMPTADLNDPSVVPTPFPPPTVVRINEPIPFPNEAAYYLETEPETLRDHVEHLADSLQRMTLTFRSILQEN